MPDNGFDAAVKDWNEAAVKGFDALRMGDTEWARAADYRAGSPALKPVSLRELLEMNLKPRKAILEGLLHERSVNMVYGWRGAGKTWFGLNLGYAIAIGSKFLKWKATEPRRVLYIDGEMPAIGLRERIEPIIAAYDLKPPEDSYFRFLPSDLHDFGLPNLATVEGQAAVDAVIGDAEVIVFDNVSTLYVSGRENEAESWLPVQTWLLKLRREGRMVVILHHAGKGKAQRGTSRREDILDVVLNLRHPSDYEPSQGARFEVHFEKARGLDGGKAVEPFEVKLVTRDGNAQWVMRDLEDAHYAEIIELHKEGKSVRAIASELDMSKSAVQRALAKAKASS